MKLEEFAPRADRIQSTCACVRWGARECYEARHYLRVDDLDEGRPDWDDAECECRCHGEIDALTEDEELA